MKRKRQLPKRPAQPSDGSYDAVIVGGGIVGLATAYALRQQRPRWRILLLEKESAVAQHQTGNNSGVIHSGVYYKPGSLKAKLCVEGVRDLVKFCDAHDVPYRRCGKIIVATEPDELERLAELHRRGKANGLRGLKLVEGKDIQRYEPASRGIKALHVPGTGIVDYGAVSQTLAEDLRSRDVEIRLGEGVIGLERRPGNEVVVRTRVREYVTRHLVTCGGLHSDRLARMTHPDVGVRIIPFRGEYYKVRDERREIVRGLIYPVPDPRFPFLGVHFTRMIDGGLEAGPNAVLAFRREGYHKTDISTRDLAETLAWPGFRIVARTYWRMGWGEIKRSYSKALFVKALRRLVPEINSDDLVPGGAGVRAQACNREGRLIDDFLFVGEGPVLHVCNAPSPAATASFAIGKEITRRILGESSLLR